MGVNVKLGVDLSSFKQGINDANAQLKSFDAQLKFAETNFKKTGDAEAAMSTKTDALTNKLKVQRQMLQQYDKALQDMRTAGIDPTSASYQKMQAAMISVQSASIETEMALQGLNTSQLAAAGSADKLTQSVNGIGKKMSLDQVISGIDKITGGLENASKKATSFAKALWGGITESAERADDIATMASILGMDIESYQRYKKTFDSFADITVKEWENARNKIQSAVVKPTDEQFDIFAALGVGIRDVDGNISPYYNRYVIGQARQWEDVFWDIGQALRNKVASKQLTQDEADVYAKALFGKGWDSLNPIFDLGREGFYNKYNNQIVTSENAIKSLEELNNQLGTLKSDFQSLQEQVLSGLAPALTEGAKAIDGLLGKLMDYLKTENGQQMLDKLSEAVSGLFSDLSKIEPDKVIEGFVGVFEKITSGLEWIVDNKNLIIHVLEDIVVGWAGLKLTGGALDVLKLIDGVKNFNGVNPGTPQTVTGGNGDTLATGSGGTFWSTVLNKLTLASLASAAGSAFNPQNSEAWQQFLKDTNGQSLAEKQKYALIHDFGEEAYDLLKKNEVPITVTPEVPNDAAAEISKDVGTVQVNAELVFHRNRMTGEWMGASPDGSHANGLWSVPYDNYLAILHRGERVLPAREVSAGRNFSSNLYVETINMNNGQEASGLAAEIAAANRRMMSGYGS